jgi:hypothetical protein
VGRYVPRSRHNMVRSRDQAWRYGPHALVSGAPPRRRHPRSAPQPVRDRGRQVSCHVDGPFWRTTKATVLPYPSVTSGDREALRLIEVWPRGRSWRARPEALPLGLWYQYLKSGPRTAPRRCAITT